MILHIDMDAFFASVEKLDNPGLKGKCVIVGGLSGRSVVSTASYEARKFGVRSAMPMYLARKKCPGGIFMQPRPHRYKEISNQVMRLLTDFSPLVEPASIDEAYVDITGCQRVWVTPQEIGVSIKKKIKEAVNLSCSIGIAPNKFLSKIASDMNKPDGLTIIMPEQTVQFIESLPIHKVPGVGKMMRRQIAMLGIQMLGDVKKYPEKILLKKLGKFGRRLKELSACIDHSPVTPHNQRKSVSSESTLPEDTYDESLLKKYLLGHSEEVGRELRKLKARAKTITLKIKHADFKQATRNITLDAPTQSSTTIYTNAVKLLAHYPIKTKIRLVGVGVSTLCPATMPVQINLFEEKKQTDDNWEKIDRAVDIISQKFGKGIIKWASLHDCQR